MNKTLFNYGWKFLKLHEGSTLEHYEKAINDGVSPQDIDLPHDWLIYDTQNLYEPSTGFYTKHFNKYESKSACLEFDGVYMNSEVYINKKLAGKGENGYFSFIVDIAPYLIEGKNEVTVLVRFSPPNSRWYSGAGIYRNVWLLQSSETYLIPHGCYLSSKKCGDDFELCAETELFSPTGATLVQSLLFKNKIIFQCEHNILSNNKMQTHSHTYIVKSPFLWDIEQPNLYRFENKLLLNSNECDVDTEPFGFRTIEFSPNDGFILNGKKTKLNGTCEHHDLGFLGAAFNESAMERRFKILKAMGVNAVRTAHNAPAKELMHLADQYGILIMSEAYDMWRLQKNKYDFARFFDDCCEKNIASWVRRDRNHPSLIMWSIGNEIYDTHINETGQEITKRLTELVLKHDKNKNAYITLCSNYMPWENAQRCADIVKLAGYNYSEKYYADHHERHPDYIIYGSETASVVQSRGIYHFPFEQSVLSDIDMQCSALGNSTTSWGAKNAEYCIIAERDTPYSCGQFLWSGFDYIGEPTPYHTKNSYFGQIDTAGLAKDSYYLYKSAWTDYKKEPFVHIFPYWDFNEGQTIDIRVASNAPKIELFLNDVSQGLQPLEHKKGSKIAAHYKLSYQKGTLLAIAYDENNAEIARANRTSFLESAEIQIISDKSDILANGTDMAFLEISMLDANGNIVENANDRVEVLVTGAARLVGLDNGDSTDYENYKTLSRRLFSGKLVAGIMAKAHGGDINIIVKSSGKPNKALTLHAIDIENSTEICANEENQCRDNLYRNEIAVRKIELTASARAFNEECKAIDVLAQLLPCGAYETLEWEIVDDRGIKSNLAALSVSFSTATVTAKGDGSFRVRCSVTNGFSHASVISQLDFTATGLGKAFVSPYELVAGGTYFYAGGTVTNGNDHGFATAREDVTTVGFTDLDFADGCSDTITLPIFSLKSVPYKLQIFSGVPEEADSELLLDAIYDKPSKWNTYQEETYKLSRVLHGVCSLYIRFFDKVHVQGFIFEKQSLTYSLLSANMLTSVYGDSFERTQTAVNSIGNNVTLELPVLDFIGEGANACELCGCSHIEKNTIHLRLEDENGNEQKHVLEFPKSAPHTICQFSLPQITGKQTVRLVFLPGSNFDFDHIRFYKI